MNSRYKLLAGWWDDLYFNSHADMGLSWNWRTVKSSNLKAYPSIVSGWNWNIVTAGSVIPVRIEDNKNINASVDYTLLASGKYNVSYDLWFHTTASLTDKSTPTDELMVWLNSSNVQPLGTFVETATLGGTTWNLYKGNHPEDWNVFTFVRTSNTSSSSLNLTDFVNHIVYYKNWMSNSKYVTSVQFGTEIFTGSGNMKINSYSVNVQ